ncbi:hypothetical protein [Streptomyces sp. NPDC048590]|uniref:hypothetical protein n=1 Tax=Streptomyces sp. NPDC048590 TaxID=3365574 RepID=UPI0037134221
MPNAGPDHWTASWQASTVSWPPLTTRADQSPIRRTVAVPREAAGGGEAEAALVAPRTGAAAPVSASAARTGAGLSPRERPGPVISPGPGVVTSGRGAGPDAGGAESAGASDVVAVDGGVTGEPAVTGGADRGTLGCRASPSRSRPVPHAARSRSSSAVAAGAADRPLLIRSGR